MRNRKLMVSAAAAGLLLVGAGVGAGTYAATSSRTTTVVRQVAAVGTPAAATTANGLSVNDIFRQNSPGVVEVSVSGTGQNESPFGGGSQTQQAEGSGFVYNGNGDIVTNEHVIDGASSIRVTFADGASYPATLVGKDTSTDIAVIHVDAPASELHPLSLGDSNTVQVGDGVVAIGSPFGLAESVTFGIVSALHRQITAPNNFPINDAIQTDAAINHGNSGGVLLNLQGQVIGVTAQIASESGGNDGVGFAISANTVKHVADGLIANGTVSHAYLGVAVATIPVVAASQLGTSAGVEVTQVRPGTAAAKADLQAATGSKSVGGADYPTGGDVIVAVDGTTVTSVEQLQSVLSAKKPGDQVTLTLVRNGAQRKATLTLGARPS